MFSILWLAVGKCTFCVGIDKDVVPKISLVSWDLRAANHSLLIQHMENNKNLMRKHKRIPFNRNGFNHKGIVRSSCAFAFSK